MIEGAIRERTRATFESLRIRRKRGEQSVHQRTIAGPRQTSLVQRTGSGDLQFAEDQPEEDARRDHEEYVENLARRASRDGARAVARCVSTVGRAGSAFCGVRKESAREKGPPGTGRNQQRKERMLRGV